MFGGGGRGDEEDEARRVAQQDKELVRDIDQLERDIDELRATYELFFMGVEKVEPQPQRDLVKGRIRRFQERRPRNTALKFRIQQLKARLVSLENYWQRTLRQREAGTYHRDVARLERRQAERARQEAAARAAQAASPAASENGEAVDSRVLAAGGGPARGAPATSHRPRASSADDLTEPKLRKLYDTYLGARRRCGESTELRYEDMASALRKQVPKLMTKTGAKSVEFKVVIRSGKAVLKALPRS